MYCICFVGTGSCQMFFTQICYLFKISKYEVTCRFDVALKDIEHAVHADITNPCIIDAACVYVIKI